MSTQTKKPSFLQEAKTELENLALDFGVEGSNLETLGDLATKLLKDSFKNGLNAGYRKAKGESKATATEDTTGR